MSEPNEIAAVKLAQEREKECQRLRWENDRLRECVADQEKKLQEARRRILELETALRDSMKQLAAVDEQVVGIVDARAEKRMDYSLGVCVEELRLDRDEAYRKIGSLMDQRDALKAELASVRDGAAQLAEELGACKRERDDARTRAQMWHDRRKASEIERDSLQQQLTEKSALCERLKDEVEAAFREGWNMGWRAETYLSLAGDFRSSEASELLQRAEGKE